MKVGILQVVGIGTSLIVKITISLYCAFFSKCLEDSRVEMENFWIIIQS